MLDFIGPEYLTSSESQSDCPPKQKTAEKLFFVCGRGASQLLGLHGDLKDADIFF